MYDRILVPTDGSTGTAHVSLHAIELAERHDSTVYAVHVVDTNLVSHLSADSDASEELTSRGHQAVEMVEQMAESHGITCETAVREGEPAGTILDYVDEVGADLIVAGTHGRSGVKRQLLGSVSERLVRHAECPVLTVRLPETDVTVEDDEYARELVEEALETAGYQVENLDVERQVSVWVGHGETDDGAIIVYLDPRTQRTTVLPQW